MFTDTHCHIYDEYYDNIEEIYNNMKDNKIYRVINNGIDNKTNIEVLDKINKYEWMFGTLGIHPEEVDNYKDNDLDFIVDNINSNKIIAIGEIGLDYHYTKENKERQIELFEKQLQIAEEYNIPVVVHSREATLDTIESLKKFKVKGVIHSFSGSYETACIYIKMGFLLGINGVVTFKNANIIEVVKKIGIDNIILETDSPYLTPTPYRGQRNEPYHIIDIVKFLENEMGVSEEEIAKITEDNIKRCFDI